MKTVKSKPILYARKPAMELEYYSEIINAVYSDLFPLKWTTNYDYEIGFYERNKKLQTEIFFGIWFATWKQYEIPLCLAVNHWGEHQTQVYQKLEKDIKSKSIEGIIIKYFDDHFVLLLDENYFNHKTDVDRISDLFIALSNLLGLGEALEEYLKMKQN
jgi:hypothetical protein